MEQITSSRRFVIQKTIPNRNLWGELKRFGLDRIQIVRVMARHEDFLLRNLLEEVKKSGRENKIKTFMEWVMAEPRTKKPKPRQRKLRI